MKHTEAVWLELIEVVRQSPGATAAEIGRKTGVSRTAATSRLVTLLGTGRIVRSAALLEHRFFVSTAELRAHEARVIAESNAARHSRAESGFSTRTRKPAKLAADAVEVRRECVKITVYKAPLGRYQADPSIRGEFMAEWSRLRGETQ